MTGQLIKELAEYELRPTAIERTKDGENDVVFYGFPLPTCKGESDNKWLIQVYVCHTDEYGEATIERTGFVNGVREFTSSWQNRRYYSYYQSKDFPYPIYQDGSVVTTEG